MSEEAIRIAESAGDTYSRLQAAFGLGTLYLIQGHADRAIAVLEQGVVTARREGIAFIVPFMTAPLGAAYAEGGEPDRAVGLLEQTVEQAVSMRLHANHALRLVQLGHAQLAEGRRPTALELGRRALQTALDRHERGQQAHAGRLLAEIAAGGDAPDVAAAIAGYQEALTLAGALGMRPLAARCRLGLARLHQRASDHAVAREHLAAAREMTESMGVPPASL